MNSEINLFIVSAWIIDHLDESDAKQLQGEYGFLYAQGTTQKPYYLWLLDRVEVRVIGGDI